MLNNRDLNIDQNDRDYDFCPTTVMLSSLEIFMHACSSRLESVQVIQGIPYPVETSAKMFLLFV